MPPIDRSELRRLALLLSLGASASACGGGASTTPTHGDPTAGGNVNAGPTAEAYYEPTAEYAPTDEAYYGPTGEAYYGPTGEGYGPTAEAYPPVYEG